MGEWRFFLLSHFCLEKNLKMGIYTDNKAMLEVEEFIKNNPSCTYQEATKSISWYFQNHNHEISPWIVDWIILCIDKYGVK